MTRCPTCNDHGRVSNGRDPMDPGYDDGPCPEPDCEAGAEEFASAMRVREREYAARKSNLNPIFERMFDDMRATGLLPEKDRAA